MALQKNEGRFDIIHKKWSVTARADEFDAWVTQPDAVGPFPCVVIIPGIYGATPQLAETAKLLSRMGWVAVVPDLYYRIGQIDPEATDDDAAWVYAHVGDNRMLADIEDTIGFLDSLGNTDVSRVGVLGVDAGGRLAFLLAARHPRQIRAVAAVNPTLGELALADGSPRSRNAAGEAEKSFCPVKVLFSGKADVDDAALVELKEVLGERAAIVTYPEAGVHFLNEMSDEYDAGTATDAYGRIIDLFDTALGTAGVR